MTENEAKDILKLYRPGSADAEDPSFAEALTLCESAPELKNWFAEHCAVYSALRHKFRQIPVPEGLKEQIVSERKAHAAPLWQKAVILAGAVAAMVLIAWKFWPQPSEPHNFAAYRNYMISFAERGYAMQDYTNDLSQIRLFLAQEGAITNYEVPSNLQKNARAAGCVATTWRGNKVSMICFQTRPMQPTQSDLWLFVTSSSTTADTPRNASPKFESVNNGITTATWTVGDKTYVLAVEKGDEHFLAQFL